MLPIQDSQVVGAFIRDFKLSRANTASGLSVVIPYCDPAISVADFQSAILREYFYPILAGRLTVILHDGSADKSLRLDSEALRNAITDDTFKIDGGLRSAMELALWSLESEAADQRVTLIRAGDSGAAEWTESLIPEDQKERLGEDYQDGRRIAIRVPVKVRYANGKTVNTWFDVYIQQDLEDRGHPPLYIRNGIIIPKVREKQVRGHRILALIVVEDAGLGTPLGDAEPPSHTHWSAETEKFTGKYKYGKQLLEFVANASRQIAELLSRAQKERDVYSLTQFFPHPGDEKVRPEPGSKPGPDPSPPPDPSLHSESLVEIGKVKAGFSLALTVKGREQPPDSITVRMAYDRESGKPLKKYSIADFVLDELDIQTDHAETLARGLNEIVLRPVKADFKLKITGFDPRRDVYVEALSSRRSGES